MNTKHLWWIIPLCIIISYLFGLCIGIPKHITIDYGDNVLKFSDDVKNIIDDLQDDKLNNYWCCLDGCYNAQIPMKINNFTLYEECSKICWNRMYEMNTTKIERWC